MAVKSTTTENNTQGLKIPWSLEAEQAVLGSVLLSQDAPNVVLTELDENDFYAKEHRIIFNTMQQLFLKNNCTQFDYIIVSKELELQNKLTSIGGQNYLITLTDALPYVTNFQTYVDIVKRDSTLRKLIAAGGEIVRNAYTNNDRENALSFAESKIYAISQNTDHSSLEQISDSLQEVINEFELCFKDPNAKRGMPTGFPGLDHYTNGFQKGDLIILAARPSFGKSSLAINFVQNAAIDYNKTCAIFSLEMPRVQLSRRMACGLSGVDMAKVIRGDLNANEQRKFRKAAALLAKAPIYIDESSNNSVAEIKSKCLRLKNDPNCGLDFVMIDYLQLMSNGSKGRAESRQQEVSDISRELKKLARELDVPVLALSQLSRAVEQRTGTDHKPQLSDLRDTGAIEQDADIVMFIHRPSRYTDGKKDAVVDETQAYLVIAKHRNGALGDVPLIWNGSTTTFKSTEKDANTASLESTAPPPITNQNKKDFETVSAELLNETDINNDIFDDYSENDIPPMDYPIAESDIPPENNTFDNVENTFIENETSSQNEENTPSKPADDDPIFD